MIMRQQASSLSPDSLRLYAPAKVNLALHVTGTRRDGYHLLDSIVSFTMPDIGDRLVLSAAPSTSGDAIMLRVGGSFAAAAGEGTHNLAYRAAALLRQRYAPSFATLPSITIELEKQLPVGAGLGGGSADAAAVLHGVNRLWSLALPMKELASCALELGADVPVCLHGEAAHVRGIGERVKPLRFGLSLPGLLVYPAVSVSTAAIFAAYREHHPTYISTAPITLPTQFASAAACMAWLCSETRNDLESFAILRYPAIAETLEMLTNSERCCIARMSGSGSACFGLYDTISAAEAAAARLRAARPDYWVRQVTLSL